MTDIQYVTEYVGLKPDPTQIPSEYNYAEWLAHWDNYEWDKSGIDSMEDFVINAYLANFYMTC